MPRPSKPLMPSESWLTLFGVAVRRLRLGLRNNPPVSQSELGKMIGFDHSTVSAVERAALKPDEQFVEACERALPAHGVLRSMYPFVVAEWEEWKRTGRRAPVTDALAPPPDRMREALGNFEHFLHSGEQMPLLIHAGVAHAQCAP